MNLKSLKCTHNHTTVQSVQICMSRKLRDTSLGQGRMRSMLFDPRPSYFEFPTNQWRARNILTNEGADISETNLLINLIKFWFWNIIFRHIPNIYCINIYRFHVFLIKDSFFSMRLGPMSSVCPCQLSCLHLFYYRLSILLGVRLINPHTWRKMKLIYYTVSRLLLSLATSSILDKNVSKQLWILMSNSEKSQSKPWKNLR